LTGIVVEAEYYRTHFFSEYFQRALTSKEIKLKSQTA